jgi:hypothetical protein
LQVRLKVSKKIHARAKSFELLCGPAAALEHPQLRQTPKL